MFELEPRLAADCHVVTDLPLCRVLLMNDANYPWCILVPRVNNITEVMQLSDEQQRQLWQESNQTSAALSEIFTPDKLNIAALGNVVSQLHVHHIARYHNDPAWPQPVWGKLPAVAYDPQTLAQRLEVLQTALTKGNTAC